MHSKLPIVPSVDVMKFLFLAETACDNYGKGKQIQQFYISLKMDKIFNIAVVKLKGWHCLRCGRTSNRWSYNSNLHYDPSEPG